MGKKKPGTEKVLVGPRLWLLSLSIGFCLFSVPPTVAPYSCAGFPSDWEPCLDTDHRSGQAILKESLAEFSTSLYHHLRQLSPSGNLLYSPISISGLLTHLLLGRIMD